jgi:hypothetical protein
VDQVDAFPPQLLAPVSGQKKGSVTRGLLCTGGHHDEPFKLRMLGTVAPARLFVRAPVRAVRVRLNLDHGTEEETGHRPQPLGQRHPATVDQFTQSPPDLPDTPVIVSLLALTPARPAQLGFACDRPETAPAAKSLLQALIDPGRLLGTLDLQALRAAPAPMGPRLATVAEAMSLQRRHESLIPFLLHSLVALADGVPLYYRAATVTAKTCLAPLPALLTPGHIDTPFPAVM